MPDVLRLTSALVYSKSNNFPYWIKIEPYANPDYNVLSIEYDWGDGKKDKIDYKIHEQNIENFTRLETRPYPLEPGNPANYSVEHLYLPDNKDDLRTSLFYDIKIKTRYFGLSTIETKTVNVFLNKIDIAPVSDGIGFFRDISLLKTRMFGPDNTILYTFEAENPNWILMSTINWYLKNNEEEFTLLPPARPYRFLSPFEQRFSTLVPLNSAIETIKLVKRGNIGVNVSDTGGGGL